MFAFEALEFNKIRELIAASCHADAGRVHARILEPLAKKSDIMYRLELLSEIQDCLRNGMNPSLENLQPLDVLFEQFRSQTFDFEEFRQIYLTSTIANQLAERREEFNFTRHLYALLGRLKPFPFITTRFEQIFDPEGDVLDTASPALRQIRRQQKSQRDEIMKTLNRKIQDSQFEKFIQEKIITQRDNRYVIPVKENQLAFVPGIVQGRSASRSSVYMEPQEIVGMNNTLNLLQEEEKREIFRIMRDFTNDILPLQEELIANTGTLGLIDFYFACGRFSNRIGAAVPQIVEQPYVKLIHARHPLLIVRMNSIQKVIPFEMELGTDFRVLVLSGPNTGGKTVTLKSVGLLTMMALSGLPIPADVSSEIGLFHHIFADIGDDQSLENALSTFSSHVMKIKGMLENADELSLVLIDEIGAATDPEQGSALGQAILEHLLNKGIKGVITTHYTALKVFAEQHKDCRNAAMQFDASRHIPTYHFQLGMPGDSFAIEVASSLGLDPELIERAKMLAGSQNVEFTDLLKKLSEQKKELARVEYQHLLQTKLLEGKVEEYQKKMQSIETEQKDIRKRSLAEAKDYIISLQKELNREMDDIKQTEKEERKTRLEKMQHKNLEKLQHIGTEQDKLDPVRKKLLRDLGIGQRVWLQDFDAIVTIISIDNDDVIVDMNGITFKTKKDRLFQTDQKPETATPTVQTKYKPAQQESRSASFELKILGNTFEEARPKIDDFIEAGVRAGLKNLRIVHGKGTGALRTKVRAYLKRHKHVLDLQTPPASAGGEGVTVITVG